MSECVCGSIITNRVGTVAHPKHGELYRFALDCPVHGIESDRAEPIILKETLDGMSEAEIKAHNARKQRDRRKKANEKRKQNRG